jgi:hypothetical protein
MSPTEAISTIAARGDTLLDPKVFAALKAVVSKRKTLAFLDPVAD